MFKIVPDPPRDQAKDRAAFNLALDHYLPTDPPQPSTNFYAISDEISFEDSLLYTADLLHSGSRLHGLQVWLALPRELESCEPSYSHHASASLPESDHLGVRIRMIAGTGFCLESPVPVHSGTLYADLQLSAGATLVMALRRRNA